MSPSELANSPPDEDAERSEAYFSSPELAQRADLLRHLTENSNLIPLVRGGAGIGKSTFISHLLDLAPENWIPVEIVADVMLQPEALLANLARMYDLDDVGDQLMESLTVRFDDLRQDGFMPVIIVDDAHLLPEASIITLLRLHEQGAGDNPLAQILLFAQPEIDNLLKTQQLQVMHLQSLQLLDMPAFTREQTERFVEHILATGESISTWRPLPVQVEKIYRESGGLPGLIKQQVRGLMSSTEKRKVRFDVTEYVPARTVIVGGIVLIIVLIGLVYQDSINSMFSSGKDMTGEKPPVLEGETLPLALPGPTVESEPDSEQAGVAVSEAGEETGVDQAPTASPPAERVAAPGLAESPESDLVEQKELELEKTPSETESEGPLAETREDSSAAAVPVPEPVQVEQAPAEPPVTPPVAKTEMEPEPQKAKVPATLVKSETKPKEAEVKKHVAESNIAVATPKTKPPAPAVSAPVIPVEERSSGLAKSSPTAPAPVEERSTRLEKKEAPAVKVTKKPAGRFATTGLSQPKREDWLLKQKASSYTIQLVGLQDEKGIKAFIRRNPLSGLFAYYHTKRNKKSWFPVLYGVYPDKKRAIQALDKLPEKLRKSGAWLRTLGSVQKDIKS